MYFANFRTAQYGGIDAAKPQIPWMTALPANSGLA